VALLRVEFAQSQEDLSAGRDVKPGPPVHEAGVTTTRQQPTKQPATTKKAN
jgi:hypothetical protein